jgi:hypothetical protein
LIVVLVAGCVPAGAEIGGISGGAPTIGEDMVPDSAYQPRIGDRAILYAIDNGTVLERLPLLKDLTAYDVYARCQQTKDGERQAELEEQGWLEWAPPGTRVSIMAMQDRTHTGAHIATQVRLIDASQKNKTLWTASDYITRLIHKEPE